MPICWEPTTVPAAQPEADGPATADAAALARGAGGAPAAAERGALATAAGRAAADGEALTDGDITADGEADAGTKGTVNVRSNVFRPGRRVLLLMSRFTIEDSVAWFSSVAVPAMEPLTSTRTVQG